MQFFLNGFRPGDPAISAATSAPAAQARSSMPSEVDVLIVGCGPTGLTLAAQLSAFPGITTRIIEQKIGPLELGQADGIACRTMEMFEAFGFSERVLKEAYWVNETCFWEPDAGRPEHVARSMVVQDVEAGLSEFPHIILNQARIHDFYLDFMRHAPAPLEPDYSRRLVDLQLDRASAADPGAYAATARIEGVQGAAAGAVETVRVRYVVGCDGARSIARQLMSRTLQGNSARQAWGVMDVLAVSNFPDIRRKAAIHSAAGGMLIIPREGGYMIRLYIELDKLTEEQRVADLKVSTERLIAVAQRILAPYTLEVKEIAWWSVYEVGQRLCERFDDLPEDGDPQRFPRCFIAGDCCHTHSPKAGQGMNVSMQDTFNLGWKLASVLLGRVAPQVLRTYSTERHAVAKELIEFDHEFARMFSAPPKQAAAARDDAIDPAEFQDFFVRHGRFTAGTATRYARSLITGDSTHQELAQGFIVGMRFHSAPVIRLCDAKPVHLGHLVRADGRWRMFAFADAEPPAGGASGLRALCEFLSLSAESPLRRYTPSNQDIDAVIEVIAVCQQGHRELSVQAVPSLLLPRKGRYQLIDYEKVYCPDRTAALDIFDLRGIDRKRGALVVVRPDQYVAQVLPLDAHRELAAGFDAFMLSTA